MKIRPGITGNQTKIVELNDTADAYGSGSVEVFATPALITLMEKTAFLSIDHLLDDGYISVGVEMNMKHKKASLPGSIITCISEVIASDNKKIRFKIIATDENGEIGQAEHTRYIVNKTEFLKKLTR